MPDSRNYCYRYFQNIFINWTMFSTNLAVLRIFSPSYFLFRQHMSLYMRSLSILIIQCTCTVYVKLFVHFIWSLFTCTVWSIEGETYTCRCHHEHSFFFKLYKTSRFHVAFICSVIHVDHRWRQKVVGTSVTHLAITSCACICSYNILMSSMIYWL